jgi:hypothetical protein
MKHIVFNEADVAVLEQAIVLEPAMAGEVVLIRDDYAVGPLYAPGQAAGWQKRRAWWQHLLSVAAPAEADALLDMVNDKQVLHGLTTALQADEAECLWIWAAQNKHDVSGYYWLISQLQPWQGRVFILYLNNLPFINDKGNIFYPQWLWQIPPREFLKARKLARPVTPGEFEIDADEYLRLAATGHEVRLLEGGKKLAGYGADYYDDSLDQLVTGDFVKAGRLVQQHLTRVKETTGDLYLLWRLKQLAETRGYEVKGDMQKGPRDFELRHPARPSNKKKDDSAAEA